MTDRRRRGGMTLIEAMIALSILAMVTALVWGGFAQTARNKQVLEEQADRYHVVRLALERMARELSTAYVSAQLNPDPSLQVVKTAFVGVDRGARDRIDFTSFSHQRLYRNAHESDQNELSYFVTNDPEDGSRSVLARRVQNRVDDDPQRGGRVDILAHDVEEFELEYLDPESREWARSWDTTQPASQPNRLPSQVKIVLTVRDPHDPRRVRSFGTRATLPMVWALNPATYNP